MLSRQSKNFIINYSKLDESCIQDIILYLEEKYEMVTQLFNQKLREQIVVKIYYDHSELLKALGCSKESKWIRGASCMM